MNRFIAVTLLAMLFLTGCQNQVNVGENYNNEEIKIKVVTTLFPQYDFTRQIAGDKAAVIMLVPPGVESHSYEPSPADIIKINSSSMFVYTGEFMESWAKRIIDGLDNKNVVILDVSQGVKLDPIGEDHEGETTEEHNAHADEEVHEFNPHIWTDPNNAMIMVDNITKTLCQIDAENADYYTKNADEYKKQLKKLDGEFKDIVANGERKEVIFGSRNPFSYFLKRYGLDYLSAYDSCSTESEPSVKIVARLSDEIKEKKLPVIFYEELREPKVAKSISDETGAKILLFHSCHNVSKEDFNSGVTYISLMEQNAKNLKEALN